MKKLVCLLFVLVFCVSLCACSGNNSSQFTVICNDGSIEKMSRNELENLLENELEYQQKYKGAHVSGKGKIEKIEKDGWSSDGTIDTVRIDIDSFTTQVWYVPADYAANYKVGDEFEVSGTLFSSMNGFAYIEADDFYE